jgi:murein DD-endopeptidase MepM/ murein hydrolase activator NlpD
MSRRWQGASLVAAALLILLLAVPWRGGDEAADDQSLNAAGTPVTTVVEHPGSTPVAPGAPSSTVPVEPSQPIESSVSEVEPGSPATTERTPPEPAPVLTTPRPVDPGHWPDVVAALPPFVVPSDCGLPLDEPFSLPNSPRDYRGGIHQGVDFICLEPGRSAVASLGGRVVLANDTYVEPDPEHRSRLLEDAQRLGRTPPWTLAMLFGRFVVLDHGVVPGAGHVVTVYAHLEVVDPAMVPGVWVEAGQRVGEIGNRGTGPAATGISDPRSIHLHWELHVDDVFVGAGLDHSATRSLYAQLFGLD